MTLKDIVRYLDLKARAEGPGTPPAEAATCRQFMKDMEAKHEDIAMIAERVQAAERGEVPPFPFPFPFGGSTPRQPRTGPRKPRPMETIIDNVVGRFVDNMTEELTGGGRQEPLEHGQIKLIRKACAEGQVCFELRMRRKDARTERIREQVLDRIHDILVE